MTVTNRLPAAKPERLAYSVEEAAEALGVSYISVFRLIQRGKLRSVRPLRQHLIPRLELEKLLSPEASA